MSKRAGAPPKKKEWKKKKPKYDPLDDWKLVCSTEKLNMKRCDQTYQWLITNNPGDASWFLSTIAGGTTDFTRISNRVRYFNFRVRGSIQLNVNATGPIPADVIRVIYFYDRQNNQGAALWSDVIQQENGASLPFDPPNWLNRGRFKIIHDQLINTPPLYVTVAGGQITAAAAPLSVPSPTSKEMEISVDVNFDGKLFCDFNATGGTYGVCVAGGLFVVYQNITGAGNYVIKQTSSIEFHDV